MELSLEGQGADTKACDGGSSMNTFADALTPSPLRALPLAKEGEFARTIVTFKIQPLNL